jgi:uncharacterized protein
MRRDKSKHETPMKRLNIAAVLALSSTVLFSSPAVAQEDAFAKGLVADLLGDYVDAAKWYRAGAEQGDARAQYNLGHMYNNGQGVPENGAEAVRWYRAAAEQGNADAQFSLGLKYDRGESVPENDVEAVKWYQLAANQGHARAQLMFGYMYIKGEGVPEDFVQAYMWWSLSAAQGDEQAIASKDKLQNMISPEEIAEAHKLSAEWNPVGER